MRYKLFTSDNGTNWIWDEYADCAICRVGCKTVAELILDALNTVCEQQVKPTIH